MPIDPTGESVKLGFRAEDEALRAEIRDWLAASYPRVPRPPEGRAMRDFDLGWQKTLWEGGWAGVSWPREHGGRGLSVLQQMIWWEEYARTPAPAIDAAFVGVSHAGPTLIACASPEQQAEHLRPILRGDVCWCQGFSEPEAGSDLASLRTHARVEGDELVVNGQKVWTSYAQHADLQELLVRTDPVAKRHAGLTWVICDMRTPGITVRPIRTIDGAEHFCEVFYDEVRIPLSNVVGRLGDGWRVAMSTLTFERGGALTMGQMKLAATVEQLIDYARDNPGPDGRKPAIADDQVARDLALARAEVAALRAMTYASVSRVTPGAETSLVKLYYAEVLQRVHALALDVIGPHALRWSEIDGRNWPADYLLSRTMSIAGGTSEIQRTIVGERVLGLPR
jgi:alkylation response protein AidB-like acyl-CoA dehydrogenase